MLRRVVDGHAAVAGSAAAETSAIARLAQPVFEAGGRGERGVARRAARAGAAPRGLGPAAGGAGRGESEVPPTAVTYVRGRREAAALVAVVTGRRGDGDARVVVVAAVGRVGRVAAAVAVGDRDDAGLLGGGVDGGAEVGDGGAAWPGRRGSCSRGRSPTRRRRRGPARRAQPVLKRGRLVPPFWSLMRQAAVGRGAGGQPEVGAVDAEVGARGSGSRRRRRSRRCGRRSSCRSACRRP